MPKEMSFERTFLRPFVVGRPFVSNCPMDIRNVAYGEYFSTKPTIFLQQLPFYCSCEKYPPEISHKLCRNAVTIYEAFSFKNDNILLELPAVS
jgi:hypothetical protein